MPLCFCCFTLVLPFPEEMCWFGIYTMYSWHIYVGCCSVRMVSTSIGRRGSLFQRPPSPFSTSLLDPIQTHGHSIWRDVPTSVDLLQHEDIVAVIFPLSWCASAVCICDAIACVPTCDRGSSLDVVEVWRGCLLDRHFGGRSRILSKILHRTTW